MRDVVLKVWHAFSAPMEGEVNHFYADVKGLITIGVGNLVDPVAAAVHLPMRRPDGTLAGRDEIIADWARVKNDPDAARLGHRRAAVLTRLHIDRVDLQALVETKLRTNDAVLANRFKQWEEWPADAQLATHSMAWACGPYFPRSWPLLSQALDAQDWQAASNNCRMNETGNPGLKPRNLINRMLYRNAAIVVASDFTEPGLDPAALYWPRDLEDEHEEVTQPNAVPSMRPDPLEAKAVNDWATVTRLPGSEDEPPPTAA